MTQEEAIKYLKAFELCTPYTLDAQGVYKTAKDRVIKAIEEQQSCEDCVSRQTVVQWLENATDDSIEHAIDSNLEFISSVTPTRKEGKWVAHHNESDDSHTIDCSCCGYTLVRIVNRYYTAEMALNSAKYITKNYCPNCGAKMIELQSKDDET